MVRLFQKSQCQHQPHIRLSSPIQWKNGAPESGSDTIPHILLSTTTIRLEQVFAIGRICSKFVGETRHRYDPFHMHSGLPTSTVSLVWRTHREEVWDRAHTHLLHAVRRQEQQANRHRRPNPEYTPGQWVWLSTKDLRLRLPCKNSVPGMLVHSKFLDKYLQYHSIWNCLLIIVFHPHSMYHF